MTGVIDVGGGLRGIYGAGVFDRCLDENIQFDLCIGVSAGSANIASFLGHQKGRNFRFYTDYVQRKEYMSLRNVWTQGCYIDLEYVYRVLSNADGEDPLDFSTMQSFDGKVFIPVTSETGETHYMTMDDMAQDDYHPLMASSALPYACKPYTADGQAFFDGGIADPIPIEKALQEGCERCVVILTKPIDDLADDSKERAAAMLLRRKYPMLAQSLREKPHRYRRSLSILKELEKDGSCLIIAPDDIGQASTLNKDRVVLESLYQKGYADAEKIIDYMK